MKTTGSTQFVHLEELAPRLATMIEVLRKNSMAIEWLESGCVELHFNEREVHGKLVGRLITDDRKHHDPVQMRSQNGKGS